MVSLDGGPSKVDDVTALPSHIQDGGYALLWQRYDNNKMAAICYYGNVMATTRWRLCVTILHLQQYSRRLNLFFSVEIILRKLGETTETPASFIET